MTLLVVADTPWAKLHGYFNVVCYPMLKESDYNASQCPIELTSTPMLPS